MSETMPSWLRAAIAAQGEVDPDEVARQAADLDLDALDEQEARRLEERRLAARARQEDEDGQEPRLPWWHE